MSYDGMVTYAMTKELNDCLSLGKVEKIYQPQPEQLLFNIHTKQGGKKLFISMSSDHSAVYLVEKPPENPAVPPSFCMVLRKHLSAGRITGIEQKDTDRIMEIFFETVDELGFSLNKKLVIEIMGKHSNVMLVDMKDGKIIDSIKHISIDVNRARQILPGKVYEYPPLQHKIPFTEISESDIAGALDSSAAPEKALLSTIQGISPALASSLAGEGSAKSVCSRLADIISSVDNGTCDPVVYIDENGKPVDFHITGLPIYEGDLRSLHFDSVSEAACYYFRHRESSNIIKQRSNDLLRITGNALDKLQLKMQKLREDLCDAENSEKYRIYGELITANLHMLKPGMTHASVTNYYDGSTIDIPLDPKYAPARNAQIYYKKYGKSKTAVKEKKLQLENVSSEIAYLESVAGFIRMASSVDDLASIKQELIENGFIRNRKNQKNRQKAAKPSPFSYTLPSGMKVLAGKNNRENDWLTLKKASGSDIWLHTKDIPGSHVILFTEKKEPTREDLSQAASIAAFHSRASSSENVPVDYTKVRYVKKPSGARPGMVIFTHNRTLYVKPQIPESNGTSER